MYSNTYSFVKHQSTKVAIDLATCYDYTFHFCYMNACTNQIVENNHPVRRDTNTSSPVTTIHEASE